MVEAALQRDLGDRSMLLRGVGQVTPTGIEPPRENVAGDTVGLFGKRVVQLAAAAVQRERDRLDVQRRVTEPALDELLDPLAQRRTLRRRALAAGELEQREPDQLHDRLADAAR